eukprot:GHUV01053942.1.p1 GENE.GHUV01053942.1~~GHUV01053942.1.p1  ORF type:complete len:126 (-),score=20.15 GHUV01053942.1:95-472(-)
MKMFPAALTHHSLVDSSVVSHNTSIAQYRVTTHLLTPGSCHLWPAGRASQNVEYVEHVDDVPAMVTSVAGRTNCLVLVERFLPGREYCIAVMGAGDAGAVAFSPVERCLAEDEKVWAWGKGVTLW